MSKVLTLNFSNYMVLSAVAVLALGGCVKFESTRTPEVYNNTTPNQAQSAPKARVDKCEVLKNDYNERTMQAENLEKKITIERHYQRVVRKNCDGQVTSDEVETVKDPHYDLDLEVPAHKKFRSVFVFNEATCDYVTTPMPISNFPLLGLLERITGDGETKLSIKGDLAPATFTFRLKEGMNNIYVRYFYDCDATRRAGDPGADTIEHMPCDQHSKTLLVQYPVFVTYVPVELPGTREVAPPEASCTKTPNN